MISAQAHSAIMRNLGRIEGYAFDMEHAETELAVISNVERICEILDAEDRSCAEQAPVRCRADLIRTLPMRELAEYLGREVGGGFDWLGWLTEPIGRKGEHHEEKPRTP